jgi:YggT family protein
MNSLMQILYLILDFYMWILLASAILSWLMMFNIVNPHNQFVRSVGAMLFALTEPVLKYIRRYVPSINGLDLSFMVLYFALLFVQIIIRNNMPFG